MAVGHQLPSVARYRIQFAMIAMLAALCTLLAPGQESYAQAAAPAAPTGLAAGSVSHDSVKLSWDDPENDSITGYQVLRRSRDGDEYEDGQGAAEFVAVADDTESAATSYTDTSVTARTRYVYRVKAINAAGMSEQSSYVNVETPGAPAAPTGLAESVVLDNFVTFEWDDPGDSSITHYKVLRREGDQGPFTTIEENTGSAATTYMDATVSADTEYEYRVIAVNSNGTSPKSDSLSVRSQIAQTFFVVIQDSEEPEEPLTALQQMTETALVSNLGQNRVGNVAGSNFYVVSQSFRTGPAPNGYDLNSVSVVVSDLPSDAVLNLAIYTDRTGWPGDLVHALTFDGTLEIGEITFTAPDDAVLSRLTNYHLVKTGTNFPSIDYTLSKGEDGGRAEGWSILDAYRTRGQEDTIYAGSVQIEITGAIRPNDAPIVDSAPDGSVDEDAPAGQSIVTVTASDPDGTTVLAWSLDAASNGFFDIVPDTATTSAEIRVRSGLNFEMASSYEVTVTVTDLGDLTGSDTLTITVNNLDEVGSLSIASLFPDLTQPVDARLHDPDGGVTNVAWRWWRGDSANGPWTAIPGEASASYAPTETDIGKYLRATAGYTDLFGSGKSLERVTDDVVVMQRGDRSGGIANPGYFGVGRPGMGSIANENDKDWFKLYMEAGKVYRIDMLGADSGDGQLRDPHLTGLYAVFNKDGGYERDGIMDSDGDTVRPVWREWDDDQLYVGKSYYNDDGGQAHNARMFLRTHPSTVLGSPQGYPDGAYYIEARSAPVDGEASGSYRMTLTEITDDDDGTRTIAVGDTAVGELDWPGDQDVFQVNVTAGRRYVMEVRPTGWWGAHWRDRFDAPGIHLVQQVGSGQSISAPTTNGLYRNIYPFTPTGTGAYRITVVGHGATRQLFAVGPYSLRVIVDPQGDEQTEAATVIADGTTVNADIDYRGDIDWFTVELDEGLETSKTFRVDVKGVDSGSGTLADPRIYVDRSPRGADLFDAGGGVGRDARTYVTVGEGEQPSGTWYIKVTAQDDGVGTYELTVAEVSDSFVWASRMFPTDSFQGPNGFCAPIINGKCVVKNTVQMFGRFDDADFTDGMVDYEIYSLRYEAAKLHLTLNEEIPEADIANLVLTVNGVDYSFSASTAAGSVDDGYNYAWSGVTEPPWTLGNFVEHYVLVEIIRSP